MIPLPRWSAFVLFATIALCRPATLTAQQADTPMLTVVDNNGKEHKLKTWKITEGTRHLSWLADKENPQGPEVFEFSEGKSAPLKTRVLTWVPLQHIRSLTFDNDKHTVTMRVAKTPETDLVLEGVTGYVGVNLLSIEAEADFGDFGKADVKFKGGVPRGIKKVIFPAAKPVPAMPTNLPAKVTSTDRDKTVHEVAALAALYLGDKRTMKLEDELAFQKTIKVGLDKLQSLTQVGDGSSARGLVFDVALKSGQQKPLVLIESKVLDKKRAEFLQGLLGRVPAGYKLFPMQVIAEVRFSDAKME